MSETLDQKYYDDLIFLGIDELVFNTQFFGQKADAMLDELAEEHGTNVSDMQKFGICERIRSFEEEYVESCKSRFLADVQAKKFKTEDEWIDYQDDLIISTVAYAKAKAETLDWSVVESEDDGETLTPEDKVQIVESFSNYTSWIDDESMGMSIVDDVNYEVAEKHQIPGSADIQSLFWDDEPIASQANAALEQLRDKYARRAQAALRDSIETQAQYEDFAQDEQNEFAKDWESRVEGFSWDEVQENAINALLDDVAPEFPNTDVNELRQKLIELYPDCSAYDATSDEAVSKLQDNMEG